MATTVYKTPHPDGYTGTLFAGYSFWLSAQVPQRHRFRELIEINGGIVEVLEKDADIKLVDHAKRDLPLHSFVEKSIQNGRLEDLEDHRAGQYTRPVGAPTVPARGSRVPYTLQDDQILWDWLQPYEKRKDQIAGNLIYQELAHQHPRHTFQSWRDRYLKRIRGRPRPGGPTQDAKPDSPEQVSSQVDADSSSQASKRKRLSKEGSSTVPSYEVDHEAKRRRRATDILPRNDPSTPVQNNYVPDNKVQGSSQNAISGVSQTDTFETALQFPLPTEAAQSSIQSQPEEEEELEEEDENFKALMQLPFPVGTSVTRPQDTTTTAAKDGEGIEEWIQKRIEKGQSGDHVLLALSCTSMDAELADQVLVFLGSGQNIPSDIPGVWTEQDDKDLLGGDGRAITRLNDKHGPELFQKRHDHLRDAAEATRRIMQEGL
ncbi:hypothetical protein UA08_08534 [Talaromyces atroroseus]|uniref:DNA-binding protein RAP1 n=1 Tax=Talaromyces atroroseus TaxID=1441469 RepID=A0A1Q5Q7Z7_TALAT|nr:hypothetical protein UA08_08534 [Talaromyces atroroseus]OKL56350.1 hypothetical protein UA08_08534 [Talaromyces atroroseus]